MLERIALVNFCFPKEIDVISPPQGLLSIATVLSKNGFESIIYDVALDIKCDDFKLDSIVQYMSGIHERIIGISTWDSVFPKVILATRIIKEIFPDKVIILGGPTVSNLKQEILKKFDWIDFCILGEGEFPFFNLVRMLSLDVKLDFDQIPSNVIGRQNGKVIRGKGTSTKDVNLGIPVINYSLIDLYKYNRFEVSTSRGCPFCCEFCSVNSILDRKLRFRPLTDIFEEIEILFSFGNIDCVNIVDDNFGLNKNRLYSFCKTFKLLYPRHKWTCYLRLDDLVPENVDIIVDSGCVGAFIGIEVGNAEKSVTLGKPFEQNDIMNYLEYATSKMDVTVSFIWGFPDENENQLIDTFSLINKLANFNNIIIDLFQLSPLTGTKIQKKISSSMTFDIEAVSGFIYPPYLPLLHESEKKLILQYPIFFSAYYHEDTSLFGNKLYMVKKFFNNNLIDT